MALQPAEIGPATRGSFVLGIQYHAQESGRGGLGAGDSTRRQRQDYSTSDEDSFKGPQVEGIATAEMVFPAPPDLLRARVEGRYSTLIMAVLTYHEHLIAPGVG